MRSGQRRPSGRSSLHLLHAAPALVTLAALAVPASSEAAQVWTASSLTKLRPDAAVGASTSAAISAARNEVEAFQVVVTGPANAVRASATALAGPGSIGDVRLHREALIDLARPSAADGAAGRWPDALVPDVDALVGEVRNAFPFDVPAGESRAIWVEVHVPPDAPAGDYAGAVDLAWSGGAARVPVSLHVWPFALPSTASLRSAFGFSWGAIPAGHGITTTCDAYSTLRARYGALALDHRITLAHVDDGDASLDHLAEYYGPALDGEAGTDLAGARMTAYQLMGGADAWAPFFAARGWSDRLFQYTCDEPPATCAWSDIPPRAAQAHAAVPPVRTLVTTTIQEADEQGVTAAIDVLTPVVNDLDDRPGASRWSGDQRPAYDAFLAGAPGRELWTYQSCMSHGCGATQDPYFTGWPSYAIDASAVRNRAMQWLAFRYGASGELYYETAMAYTHDPWSDQWDFGGNGDGTLFYPGTPARIGGATDVPVASIRLAELRDGMEDYEYLKLCSDLGDPGLAHAEADALFPHPYETEVAPARLQAARARLAARIVELSGVADPGAGGAGSDPAGESGGPDGGGSGGASPAGGAPVRAGCSTSGELGTVALLGLLALVPRRRRRTSGRSAASAIAPAPAALEQPPPPPPPPAALAWAAGPRTRRTDAP